MNFVGLHIGLPGRAITTAIKQHERTGSGSLLHATVTRASRERGEPAMLQKLLQRMTRHEHIYTFGALCSMFAVIAPIMLAIGITAASGFPKFAEIVVVFAAGCLMLSIATVLCASVLAFIPWRWPWLTISAGMSMFAACSVTMWKLNVYFVAAAAMTGAMLLLAACSALAAIWLFKHRRSPRVKAYGALTAVLLIAFMLWRVPPSPLFGAEEADGADYDYEQNAIPIAAPNPSLPGGYEVISFTYGTGDDVHRSRYADDVLL